MEAVLIMVVFMLGILVGHSVRRCPVCEMNQQLMELEDADLEDNDGNNPAN